MKKKSLDTIFRGSYVFAECTVYCQDVEKRGRVSLPILQCEPVPDYFCISFADVVVMVKRHAALLFPAACW